MEVHSQRSIFLNGEGDQWHSRNGLNKQTELDHLDSVIHQFLHSCNSVLEVGCADGRRLSRIRNRFKEISLLVGIDPSRSAISSGLNQFIDLDLRVGTADALPQGETFDAVIIGFCLYLCDRDLLSKIVSEVDRVLKDQGVLILIDFDPPHPRRRKYRHRDGVWTYKMDYSLIFSALPHFILTSKTSMSHSSNTWVLDERERVALWSLRKNLTGGYSEEEDF